MHQMLVLEYLVDSPFIIQQRVLPYLVAPSLTKKIQKSISIIQYMTELIDTSTNSEGLLKHVIFIILKQMWITYIGLNYLISVSEAN